MRPHIVIVGNNAALSAAVQREFFQREVKWNSFGDDLNPAAMGHIAVGGMNGCNSLTWSDDLGDFSKSATEHRFDAATEFGKWLAFMDEPEKSLGQVAFEAFAGEDYLKSCSKPSLPDDWENAAQAVIAEHEKRKAGK